MINSILWLSIGLLIGASVGIVVGGLLNSASGSYGEENEKKKLFALNEDGVTEWVIAYSKKQAFEYIDYHWGGIGIREYFKEFKQENPEATLDEFIESYVREEPMDKEFTLDGVKKTVREHLKDETVPSLFGVESY